MKFKKGNIPWNKGKKHSDTTRKKISETKKGCISPMKGKKHSKTSRINMSNGRKGMKLSETHIKNMVMARKGYTHLEDTKRKIGLGNKGKIISKETKIKISGKNHYNWKGGISNNPYPKEFNAELKLRIRIRDNFICCLCGKTERKELEEINQVLCVNHIDFDKNNCKKENLNTLCLRCNVKINREREYWTNYFNKLIF